MKTTVEWPNLHLSAHPLVQAKLTRLRDRDTAYPEFRRLMEEISLLLFYEASGALELASARVQTPLEPVEGKRLARSLVLVPILRAGLGMVNGIIHMVPEVRVGMLGMYRDEETLQPVYYYQKLPPGIEDMEVFLLDPMLATGGSSAAAATRLKEAGCRRLRMVAILCAPEGVKAFFARHPDVPVFAGGLDRQLNDRGFILPGLGDAGDRYFGT